MAHMPEIGASLVRSIDAQAEEHADQLLDAIGWEDISPQARRLFDELRSQLLAVRATITEGKALLKDPS